MTYQNYLLMMILIDRSVSVFTLYQTLVYVVLDDFKTNFYLTILRVFHFSVLFSLQIRKFVCNIR